MSIPQELRDIQQWTHSFDHADLKRPKHSHYTPNNSLSYNAATAIAKRERLSFGFYCTLKDNLVIGDIDHVDDPNDPSKLPVQLADLLINKGAYSEVSPSGEGIRFVVKLPKNENKSGLNGKVFYTRDPLENKREAQINIGPPWLRFTGNETPYSSGSVGEISLAELDEIFALKYKDESKGVTIDTPLSDVPTVTTDEKMPTLQEVQLALDSIPLDQSPRIVRAYEKVFKQAYSHYDFWLRILMGIHDFAAKTGTGMDCLTLVAKWSSTDPTSYSGEEDVIAKWQSFSSSPEKVSFHTLFAVAYANTLIWPMVKPLTKAQKAAGVTKREPINTEYVNFRALVDFYNLKVHLDVNANAKMYVTGDPDIMKKYFHSMSTKYYYGKYRGIFDEKSLMLAVHIMCQSEGFVGLSHQQVQQHLRNWIHETRNTLDLVRYYFDTPFEDLPEEYQDNRNFISLSTVEYMFNCLELDYLTQDHTKERQLYYKYYKSWLMGMVRNLYFPNDPHMNNCVLLLTGPEQIRKTSHFRYMLPKFMREERIAFTTHGFSNESSLRDLIKLASGCSLLVWDEIEQYLNAETESNFKKLIDSTPTKFIDKYATIETNYKPIAMYGGTSNQREFKLSDTGSRRLFIIPVKWVHTDRLDNVCWWRIINDLRDEMLKFRGDNPPWLLSKDQLEYQAELHSRVTAKSNLEIIIREVFDFNQDCILPRNGNELTGVHPPKHPNFCSTKKVIDLVSMHANGNINISRAQLVRILHNLCGQWTKTKTEERVFTTPRMTVRRGMASYGTNHKLWVMPTPINPYEQN